jgi:hypothetical protein
MNRSDLPVVKNMHAKKQVKSTPELLRALESKHGANPEARQLLFTIAVEADSPIRV